MGQAKLRKVEPQQKLKAAPDILGQIKQGVKLKPSEIKQASREISALEKAILAKRQFIKPEEDDETSDQDWKP